ncbi:RAD26-like SNF2 family DNA-dependent ATPase [Lyophyllum atratum]|nr:RAD26-like SNF2 family DNA-dependent ATPase [Lyophyllum atratum]
MSKPAKESAYSKRNTASIPAPLDPDSDSDFAPGAYIPEPTKKRKRASAVASTSSGVRERGKRLDVGRPSKRKRGQGRPGELNEPNPLLQYFAEENLDLCSESEGDDDEPRAMDDDDDEEEEEEEEEEDQPIVLKTLVGFVRDSKNNSPSPGSVNQARETIAGDDSATEPESDVEHSFPKMPALISCSLNPRKGAKVEKPGDESVTESDDDEPQFVGKTRPLSAADSETESDSEYDLADPRLKPRPGFPLAPDQVPAGPLVLDEDKKISVPASINTYLRDYQRDGVQFLWRQYSEGRGGLLGDDMGLGKTIQVISFLSAIMHKNGVITDRHRRKEHVSLLQDLQAWKKRRELPPADATWPTCLIIAPSTVVHNWQREFETWGYFEVGLYNGTRKERDPVLHDFKMGRLDVVLTTFDLARRDIDILDSLPWTCVFVDEVHRVKNVTAKITVAYHQFLCNRRFGLTGTTIQNSYKEMWTILDWTNPGRLGTARQWQGFVVKPLTAGQSAGANEDERAKALVVALVLKNKLLPNFFLRRTKDIIRNQLPKKTDEVVFCPLTARQISVYKHILNMAPVQNLIHRDDPCSCGSRKSRKNCCGAFVPGDVFKFMSILIKLSNHLALILPSPSDTADQIARNRALAELAFPEGDIPKYGTAMMQPKFCGKWAVLELLLKEWRRDPTNKVLIFTKSVKLLEMLEFHLKSRGYGFLKLDGSTKQADRMPMIDKFHSDPSVFLFLISTLAGGTGLNLTGANKVVIFDPNWNPAHDLQAMDRAFRFGQTRDVSVYRLLGAGSVEELIYARQIYKQQQMAIGYEASVQTRYFEGIQGDTAKKGELFGIENIFRLHEDKLATKMAIERANLAELDWALANMGGSRPKRQNKSTGEDWVAEAEAKGPKDKEDVGNLRGLGALLFDDAPPTAESREQDVIQKTLSAIGVKYSHHNDQVLVPSRIEEQRTKKTLLDTRRRKSRQKADSPGKNASPKPQWPPIRKHHKPPPTPEEQLAARHQALIELGMINHPGDVPTFARDFARQSPEMQKGIIAELDKWARTRDFDSD